MVDLYLEGRAGDRELRSARVALLDARDNERLRIQRDLHDSAQHGAVLFSFPMLMTMEMWSLGVSLRPLRLMLFVAVHLLLLMGMASYARHDAALAKRKDVLDAFAAYGVGVLASAAVLLLFGVVGPGMSADAINRVISIQAAPAGFGAMVAHLELDEPEAESGRRTRTGSEAASFSWLLARSISVRASRRRKK